MRKPDLLLTIMTVAVATGRLQGAVDTKGVEYGRAGDKSLLLDLHVPDGTGPFPAAILVHGGGFDEGSKSTNVRPLFEPLANAGFAWFSIDYRLAPAAHFEDSLADVNTAIKWLKENAAEYRVDAGKIVLIGESAGGYLVNYAGTHETPDTKVAAVVDIYGPSDYGTLAERRRDHPEQFDMEVIKRHAAHGGGIYFFGVDKLDETGLKRLHAMAPIAGVHHGMPPFLIIHGTHDDQVSFEQSPIFCDAIRKTGTDCELIKVPGGAHGMGRWKAPEMQEWKPEMVAWLKKTLKMGA